MHRRIVMALAALLPAGARQPSFVFLALTLSPVLNAQEFRGTVTGRVVDAQQSAIPNAKVVATLVATGAQSVTNTGMDGQFTIPFLAPGTYKVEADAPGFKKYIRENLGVSAGDRVSVDIQLQVGQQTESITVTADAPMLDTTTATAGQVINSERVENLPMNGRTPLVLAQLAFGVVPN